MMYVLGGETGGLGKAVSGLANANIAVGRVDCDLTSDASVWHWAERLLGESDPDDQIHVLNLAGVSRSAMIHKGSGIDWSVTLEVNLLGAMRLIKCLRVPFKARPGSTLTFAGSVTTRLSPVGTGAYTATKSALEGLTRVAGREMAPFARVNLLELGYFDVGMIREVKDKEALLQTIPLGRLGTATDLWEAWSFIRHCKYVTGAVIPINGGIA